MPKLFIIDDDIDLLNILKILLTKKDFDVITFSNWVEAEAAMKLTKPQILLLDIFLGGNDGLEICKKLKSSSYTRDIQIIVASGHPLFAERAVTNFGAADFITKPFEVTELIRKIHSILSRRAESS